MLGVVLCHFLQHSVAWLEVALLAKGLPAQHQNTAVNLSRIPKHHIKMRRAVLTINMLLLLIYIKK